MAVSQARLTWTFAHAHRRGGWESEVDCAALARHGYAFIRRRLEDPRCHGYYWSTDANGDVESDRKHLYAQSFIVFAFVEYARATGDEAALAAALDLFHLIMSRCRDSRRGGWDEHFSRRWRRLGRFRRVELGSAGRKSGNAHLHWMEALSELYRATADAAVGAALRELVDLNSSHFYPADRDGSAFTTRSFRECASERVGFGHAVEAAWLMLDARRALGSPPDWAAFHTSLTRLLCESFDEEYGGIFEGRSAAGLRTSKVWWIQAEAIAALTESLLHREDGSEERQLAATVRFALDRMTDDETGIWYSSCRRDGTPEDRRLAGVWKAGYHEFRALTKFVEAFG